MAVNIRSEEVRKDWAKTIDFVYGEREDVVVERYGRPIVTIVNHIKWQAVLKRLAELELVIVARQRLREIEEDPSQLISQEEFDQMLIAEGLLPSSQLVA